MRWLAVGVALTGLGADQASKHAILGSLQPGRSVDILGSVLRFTLVRNPGAAFSLGTGMTVVLSGFAIVALLGCLVLGLPRVSTWPQGATLGLLMAGIAGNLYDRLFQPPYALHGHVIDFIQLPRFAIFNVADICITVAAGLVILLSLRHDAKTAAETPKRPTKAAA